jgi:hypothetical protein
MAKPLTAFDICAKALHWGKHNTKTNEPTSSTALLAVKHYGLDVE